MNYSLPPFWEHFNFSFDFVESQVLGLEGAYKNLSQEALYTSYQDLITIFSHPLIHGSFLDLGCGSGQVSILYGYLFPDRLSFGIDFVEARLKLGLEIKNRYMLNNLDLRKDDLLSCYIPHVDTYFLYFPTGHVLDRILSVLYNSGKIFRLVAIESHGDLFPRLGLEKWLLLKDQVLLHSKRHNQFARIYESTFSLPRSMLPFEVSFRDKYIIISDNSEIWIGESFKLAWIEEDRFELRVPPRTIFWRNVQKIIDFYELSADLQMLVTLRQKGLVRIDSKFGIYFGEIRKIVIEPSFLIELSTGERLEFKNINSIYLGEL